jgi:hypothetical protein
MLVRIQIKDILNYTVTFSNDLRETVEAFLRVSYVQFDFDENNRNSAVSLELIFYTAFGRYPTL